MPEGIHCVASETFFVDVGLAQLWGASVETMTLLDASCAVVILS